MGVVERALTGPLCTTIDLWSTSRQMLAIADRFVAKAFGPP
jgi:hypothetical protein